ncbi:MAG: lasso peptide biosynthesis B2 protein, partial [Chloroflexia bacterium]|nr:lasso peptide biosynthesis B2 protein [Chloroflexia bacterium]
MHPADPGQPHEPAHSQSQRQPAELRNSSRVERSAGAGARFGCNRGIDQRGTAGFEHQSAHGGDPGGICHLDNPDEARYLLQLPERNRCRSHHVPEYKRSGLGCPAERRSPQQHQHGLPAAGCTISFLVLGALGARASRPRRALEGGTPSLPGVSESFIDRPVRRIGQRRGHAAPCPLHRKVQYNQPVHLIGLELALAQGFFTRNQAKLRKLVALSWADRWLLVEVFVLLGLARLALRVVPFRRLARALGTLHVETPTEAPPEHLAQARRVGLAIARVHRLTPWTSNCFPQALAARSWLARRHIPTTLYLGVALNKT